MPTSLFQYEMLPTTWFYLSSLLILAVFFRFNRLFCIRNFDVTILLLLSPGLIYIAMGAAFQGYLWLWLVGALIFWRLTFDVFLRRRPLLEPNLSFAGLAFSCCAACAFVVPNLLMNRGDACESPRAWRLEQILAAAERAERIEESEDSIVAWPGYRPFLRLSRRNDLFFAPSASSWQRAVAEILAIPREDDTADFFGMTIRASRNGHAKRRSAARVAIWASGASSEPVYDFGSGVGQSYLPDLASGARALERERMTSTYPVAPDDVQPAMTVPTAPVAPSAQDANGTAASPWYNAEGVMREPRNSYDAHVRATPPANNPPPHEPYVRVNDVGFKWQPLSLNGLVHVLTVATLHIALFLTIVLIGKCHFGSFRTGCAACLLYLLLPYVNQFSARLDHIVPGLAILMAVLFYRRPFLSGVALGVAGSLVFYPFFLFPLWIGYYWKKGLLRFLLGSSATVLTFATFLLFITGADESYASALASMFGHHAFFLARADGLWEYMPRFYRIPLIALFGAICFGYALWLPRKNLAALLSCSAALMLAVQFWTGRQGGLYMAWYLPLIVLTCLRPNLSDRTAQNSVVDV
ncbi:MAG: hypothetical protein Q4G03_05320 [Planctomycetia bacterium]|nr:hypothetical protein [Planctomycetia bacterium]